LPCTPWFVYLCIFLKPAARSSRSAALAESDGPSGKRTAV